MPGIDQTVSHYRIIKKIGKGGMGEVYQAKDTKLGRDVAIKVLPQEFAKDADRVARFQREAKLLASLNHPNIAAIYGLEESDGTNFLVMELVEGSTLGDRIKTGAIPVEEALRLALQIAEALEAAHEKGVIHRDLKPANIMVTPDGKVKILDFGLAKAFAGDEEDVNLPDSPTLSARATQKGIILGTAAYMSPEQARGEMVDKKADIWAFGVVFFEMLTGRQTFTGGTVSDTLASVLAREPEWNGLPPNLHPRIRFFLERCLKKEPKNRLSGISDARVEIQEVLDDPSGVFAQPVATTKPQKKIRLVLPWVAWSIAAVSIVALFVDLWAPWRGKSPVPDLIRFQITLPEGVRDAQLTSISPDGRWLAFVASELGDTNYLWVYRFDSMEARKLAGVELSFGGLNFWSPDSRYIAFQTSRKLKKVSVTGGSPETICDLPNDLTGGSWNRDSVIIFGIIGGGLMRVSANGGTASPLIRLNSERQEMNHFYPTFLPDGHHFLYSSFSINPENSGVYLGSLDANLEEQAAKMLVKTSYAASYMPATDYVLGQLIFMRDQVLMAQPFDDKKMELIGVPVSVVDIVGSSYNIGFFSVSENGVLAYMPGDSITSEGKGELVWMDREGNKIESVSQAGAYGNFRLSPDEKKVAFDHNESGATSDVYILDMVNDVTSRLTFNSAWEDLPIWSPDGLQILFPSNRSGSFDLYLKAATGAGQEEVLVKMGTPTGWATDWSRDGRFILYQIPGDNTGQDLWIAPQSDDQEPFPYLQSEFNEAGGMFSPDGKWIAYVSNETGRNEIYVQSFPLSGAKFQVSGEGGSEPSWSADSEELFYVAADRSLMALPVTLSPIFERGQPKRLMSVPVASVSLRNEYAVSSDGKRFLIVNPVEEGTSQSVPIRVIFNWTSLLEK